VTASIRHARVLGVPDQTDPYLVNGVSVDPATVVQPSDWDAGHVITGVPLTARIDFVQTSGNGVYTGSVTLPAGAVLLDIVPMDTAAWDSTTALLNMGDGVNATGFIASLNLTALGPMTTGVGYSYAGDIATNGGFLSPGAYANAPGSRIDYPAGGTITATITQTGAGTAGRTSVVVVYTVPTVTLAVKV